MGKDVGGKRERARKGEEMAGWEEDELVGSMRKINGREKRLWTATSSGSLDRDLAIETDWYVIVEGKKNVYISQGIESRIHLGRAR
jgi:hypothetical protein